MPEPMRTSTKPSTSSAIKRFAHRGPGYAELPGQIALRRQPLPGLVFARPDERADLVGDLPIQPAGLDTLEWAWSKAAPFGPHEASKALRDSVAKQNTPIWSSGLTNFAVPFAKMRSHTLKGIA